jgi:LacI family transcriptional regulator
MSPTRRKVSPRSPPREASLAGVARACGLSIATVSLALNRNPRVAAATQQRVRAAAQRLGYSPNPMARRLALSRFHRVGRASDQVGFVLVSGVDQWLEQPYMLILSGADREIARHGGNLVFFHCEGAEGMSRLMRVVRHGAVDGWLVLGFVDETIRRFMEGLGRPFVVLGEHRCRKSVLSVDVDYHAAGAMAARALAAMGHRRVGFIGATMRFAYQREMRDGFRGAVRGLGLDADPGLIQTGEQLAREHTGWPSLPQASALLALKRRPTAVVVSEPGCGAPVLSVLRQCGLEVPRQASLLACDWRNSVEATMGLSLVELPLEEVGVAGITLLRQQAAARRGAPRAVRVAPRLRHGWSSAFPPGAARR